MWSPQGEDALGRFAEMRGAKKRASFLSEQARFVPFADPDRFVKSRHVADE